jgi:hypothetical protein
MRTVLSMIVPALLMLLNAGCVEPGSGLGGGGAIRPLAIAERSGPRGDLESDGPGFEVTYILSEGLLDSQVNFLHQPMRNDSGAEVDINALDVMFLILHPPEDDSAGFYLKGGLGGSLLYMYFDEGPDMGGMGLVTRAGVGFHVRNRVRLEAFGDAHGWLGGDEDNFRSAFAVGLGLAVYVIF